MSQLELVKQLRDSTGASMMACKKALEENGDDYQKALDHLRKKGAAKAMERGEKVTGEGVVMSYLHSNGRLGAMIQLGCETDFVARNETFIALAKDLAMQVAANNPLVLSPEDIDSNLIDKEKEIWTAQLKEEGKNDTMIEQILENKAKKFREENSLIKQTFLKNLDITVEQLMLDSVNKMGENVRIVKFARFSF